MSLALPKLVRGLLIAGWLLGALTSVDAQQPTRRRPPQMEFTEPGSTGSQSKTNESTNTSETTPKKLGLGPLDQTIRKPYEFFNAEDSFGAVSAPPVGNSRPSALSTKRARELQDRKKNWVFNSPEDVYGLPTTEQMLNAPEYDANGEKKKPKTSLERYFDRMEKNHTESATNHVGNDRLPDWLKPDDLEDKLSSGSDDKSGDHSLFGLGKANSKNLSGNSDSPDLLSGWSRTADKNYNDFFNHGSSDSSSKPVVPDAALAGRMQTFKQLLAAPSSPSLGAGFEVPTPSSAGASPLSSPFSAGTFGRDSFSPQAAPHPSSLPTISPGTTLPNSYAPTYAPTFSAPRSHAPPSSAFEIPQRKF